MSNELTTLEKSPIELVRAEQVSSVTAKIRVMIPDASKMNDNQIKHIAQQSILTRTMPGRDKHYFLDQHGNLKDSDDYKYLIAWAQYRERYLTNDPTATFEDTYQELTTDDKLREGIAEADIAAYCIITTRRDRERFRQEVKAWADLGLPITQAIEAARGILGEVGTRSVGVFNANDIGNSNKMPKGWTPLQKAKKLALKNAIHLKYGQPSIDDLQNMTRAMANLPLLETDWANVPIDIPAAEQVRLAELAAQERQRQETDSGMTIEGHVERLDSHVQILRGPEDDAIGESDRERFCKKTMKRIPFYTTESQIFMTLLALNISYDPENEDFIFDALAREAQKQADTKAS